MVSRRWVVFGLALVAMNARSAIAAEQSAHDFLAGIYAAYKGKNAKGISINTRAKLARYFTPALARLIDADARSVQPGDMGVLGSDPFIDAQDFEIAAVAIEVTELGGGKALGTVKFKNISEDQTISLDLLKLKAGWRIDEIRGPSNKSLRELLKKP